MLRNPPSILRSMAVLWDQLRLLWVCFISVCSLKQHAKPCSGFLREEGRSRKGEWWPSLIMYSDHFSINLQGCLSLVLSQGIILEAYKLIFFYFCPMLCPYFIGKVICVLHQNLMKQFREVISSEGRWEEKTTEAQRLGGLKPPDQQSIY